MSDSQENEPAAESVATDAGKGESTAVARTPRFEILIAVMLGVAALLTAGAAYLADRDDGLQLKSLEQASLSQSEAYDAFANGDRQKALDQTIFINYALAVNQGESDLSFYLIDFSPELRDAIEIWVDTDLQTPFSGENPPYFPDAYADGETLQAEADDAFAQGDFHDQRGDQFVVATVLFAVALALLGVASVIWLKRWRNGLAVGGGAFMIAGVVLMVVNIV